MKLTWIHQWDEAIERLDFADLDPSFKVTGDIGMSNLDKKKRLSSPCDVNQLMDYYQTLRREPVDGLLSNSW